MVEQILNYRGIFKNNKGKIILIGNKDLIKKYSQKYKFKISDKRKVFSGKHEYEVFVLTK